jgi:hypothetical protein
MEATIRISLNELTPAFIDDLKRLFKGSEELELTIGPSNDFGLKRKETREEYLNRIDRVLDNLEKGRFTSFSEEELGEYANRLQQ